MRPFPFLYFFSFLPIPSFTRFLSISLYMKFNILEVKDNCLGRYLQFIPLILNLHFHTRRISCSACWKANRRMKHFSFFFTFRILLCVLLVQRSGTTFNKMILTFRLKSTFVCKSFCRVEYFTVYSFDAVNNLCYCLEWWKNKKLFLINSNFQLSKWKVKTNIDTNILTTLLEILMRIF